MGTKEKNRKEAEVSGKLEASALATALALCAKGEHKRAAYVLLPRISRAEADPEEHRLLVSCYLELGNPTEALARAEAISGRAPDDIVLAGRCLLALGRWDDAATRFARARAASDSPTARFGQAQAKLRDRRPSDLPPREQSEIVALLEPAIRLPNCPAEAYLLLAELDAAIGRDPREQAKVLGAAITAHPTLARARIRLAELLLDKLNEPANAQEVLGPAISLVPTSAEPTAAELLAEPGGERQLGLAENSDLLPWALWLGFRAAAACSQFDMGLGYVERLRPYLAPAARGVAGVGADKLRGDLCLRAGDLSEALAAYEIEIRRDDTEASMVSLFSRTEALLGAGAGVEALATARLALRRWHTEWAEGASLDWLRAGAGCLRSSDPAHPVLAYDSLAGVDFVCRRLAVPEEASEPELAAQASCLLYYYHDCPATPEGDSWLQAAALLDHPRLSQALSRHYLEAGDLAEAVRLTLRHAIWLVSSAGGLSAPATFTGANASSLLGASEDAGLVASADGFAALSAGLAAIPHGEPRLAAHRLSMEMLAAYYGDADTVRRVFLPYYRTCWRELLVAEGLLDELLDAATALLRVVPGDSLLLLDLAQTLASRGLLESAERAYRDLLRLEPGNAEAHHALSLILEKRQALRPAVDHSSEALRLAPNAAHAQRHVDLQARLADEERLGVDYEDLLKSAPYRWQLLSQPEKTLLGVLSSISAFRDWEHLSRLTGLDEQRLPRYWQRIVDLGMIVSSRNRGSYEVNEYIRPSVIASHPGSVLSRVINSGAEGAIKCLFNSTLEIDTYRALVDIFPHHLILPDMALATVFDFERMQRLLTPEAFNYYRLARVDFCIFSTTSYVPFLAIETDSHYHDRPLDTERDRTKDLIFDLGGLPLLRFRPLTNRDAAAIRRQLQELIRGLRGQVQRQLDREGYRNASFD